MVFGQYERRQCVAMNVCFLVYNHAQGKIALKITL